jgi:hypothetical protein
MGRWFRIYLAYLLNQKCDNDKYFKEEKHTYIKYWQVVTRNGLFIAILSRWLVLNCFWSPFALCFGSIMHCHLTVF